MEMSKASIGRFKLEVPLGIGTMFWGAAFLDSLLGPIQSDEDLRAVASLALSNGITLFDTAEGYGGGSSETRLALALPQNSTSIVMTKFLPAAWRWTEASFYHSLEESTRRLGKRPEVFYIHTPVHPLFETWVKCACKARAMGLIEEIGLSNCGSSQVDKAVAIATSYGQRISANQVLYSLLSYGSPCLKEMERVCKRHGITIVAYSVLGQGLLTDNLTREKFADTRAAKMTGVKFEQLKHLRSEVSTLAVKHQATMAQVCLNWAIQKGVVPLVGCKNTKQLEDSMGCLRIRLSPEEVSSLDKAALSCATLEKSLLRRALFVLLISTAIMFYYLTRWVPDSWFRKEKKKN